MILKFLYKLQELKRKSSLSVLFTGSFRSVITRAIYSVKSIKIEPQPSESLLQELGVYNWPIWTQEASEFHWMYDEQETCYLLAGEVIVTLNQGEVVSFGEGDLVTFPAGMSCTWTIIKAARDFNRSKPYFISC